MDGTPRRSSDLRLHGWSRRTHTIQTIEGGASFGTPLAGFGERVWLRGPDSGKSEQVQSEVHRGEVARILPQIIPLHRGGSRREVFAWSERSKEPTLTTDGKLCRKRILSQPLFLESTPAEFTCLRGTRGEVNPAAQRLERHPVDALPPDPDHDPVPRRLLIKQRDFMAHGMSDRCPGLQSTDQWWPCTGPHRRVSNSR